MQAVPAEGALGAGFALTALYVDQSGPHDPSAIDWATCLLQKPLGEPGPIDESCFVDASPDLVSLGHGGVVHGTIPQNACQLFGPDSPPPQMGQPSTRPTDPDTTGGVDADGGASPIAADAADAGPALAVAAGERVALRVEWPACSGNDACGGAESYLYIDPASKQIVTRRESMVASWYAGAGSFDEDRSGRSETDTATSAENTWTAPKTPGPAHLWVVLRDARGGVGWAAYTVVVEP